MIRQIKTFYKNIGWFGIGVLSYFGIILLFLGLDFVDWYSTVK